MTDQQLHLAVALDEPGGASGEAIEDEEASYPAIGGVTSPGFPAKRQGLDFLGEPVIAPVSPDLVAPQPRLAAAVERRDLGPVEARHVGLHLVADLVLQIGEMPVALWTNLKYPRI